MTLPKLPGIAIVLLLGLGTSSDGLAFGLGGRDRARKLIEPIEG